MILLLSKTIVQFFASGKSVMRSLQFDEKGFCIRTGKNVNGVKQLGKTLTREQGHQNS